MSLFPFSWKSAKFLGLFLPLPVVRVCFHFTSLRAIQLTATLSRSLSMVLFPILLNLVLTQLVELHQPLILESRTENLYDTTGGASVSAINTYVRDSLESLLEVSNSLSPSLKPFLLVLGRARLANAPIYHLA